MTSPKKRTQDNQQVWDEVAPDFIDASALPVWGPFGVGADLDLITDISGKSFVEIGCGSGRSIKYLTDRGAAKVVGIDFSQTQIDESKKYNAKSIAQGLVELYQAPMEDLLEIEPVDCVFSVYALGWTLNPEKVFANIYNYLKPGGELIWSWDHSIFSDVSYKDGSYIVTHSYHRESPIELKQWHKSKGTAHIAYRKVSTWFKLQRDVGFEVIGFYEPAPVDLSRGHTDPNKYYAIDKANLIPSTAIFRCRRPLLSRTEI